MSFLVLINPAWTFLKCRRGCHGFIKKLSFFFLFLSNSIFYFIMYDDEEDLALLQQYEEQDAGSRYII